jgi:hypothetical protein
MQQGYSPDTVWPRLANAVDLQVICTASPAQAFCISPKSCQNMSKQIPHACPTTQLAKFGFVASTTTASSASSDLERGSAGSALGYKEELQEVLFPSFSFQFLQNQTND